MRFRLSLTALIVMVLAGPVWARGSDGDDDRNRVRRATTILFADDPTLLSPEPFEVAPWLAHSSFSPGSGPKISVNIGPALAAKVMWSR